MPNYCSIISGVLVMIPSPHPRDCKIISRLRCYLLWVLSEHYNYFTHVTLAPEPQALLLVIDTLVKQFSPFSESSISIKSCNIDPNKFLAGSSLLKLSNVTGNEL